MDAFLNAAQCRLSWDSSNVLISLYCSGDTSVTIGFRTGPKISTYIRLRYFHAVLGFFQNTRCIIASRSSRASADVNVSPDLKEWMVNTTHSPSLRVWTLSALVMSGADMGVFPVMGVPVFGRWEIVEERHSSVMFQPSAECCYEAQSIHLVSYSTVVG